jgi:hypothetical protein
MLAGPAPVWLASRLFPALTVIVAGAVVLAQRDSVCDGVVTGLDVGSVGLWGLPAGWSGCWWVGLERRETRWEAARRSRAAASVAPGKLLVSSGEAVGGCDVADCGMHAEGVVVGDEGRDDSFGLLTRFGALQNLVLLRMSFCMVPISDFEWIF